MKQTSILDWLDFDNQEHLRAIRSVLNTGRWPNDVLVPNNVMWDSHWVFNVCEILAKRYLDGFPVRFPGVPPIN